MTRINLSLSKTYARYLAARIHPIHRYPSLSKQGKVPSAIFTDRHQANRHRDLYDLCQRRQMNQPVLKNLLIERLDRIVVRALSSEQLEDMESGVTQYQSVLELIHDLEDTIASHPSLQPRTAKLNWNQWLMWTALVLAVVALVGITIWTW